MHVAVSIFRKVSRNIGGLSTQPASQAWLFGDNLVACRCYENLQFGHLLLNVSTTPLPGENGTKNIKWEQRMLRGYIFFDVAVLSNVSLAWLRSVSYHSKGQRLRCEDIPYSNIPTHWVIFGPTAAPKDQSVKIPIGGMSSTSLPPARDAGLQYIEKQRHPKRVTEPVLTCLLTNRVMRCRFPPRWSWSLQHQLHSPSSSSLFFRPGLYE